MAIEEDLSAKDSLSNELPNDLRFSSMLSEEEAEEILRTRCIEFVIFDQNFDNNDLNKIIRELKAKATSSAAVLVYFRLRGRLRALPIVVLRSRQHSADDILGSISEIIAKQPVELADLSENRRAAVTFKEGNRQESELTVEAGGLIFDVVAKEVIVEGHTIKLSQIEFKLLQFLASHPRQVFSRDRLLSEALNRSSIGSSRNIDVHIRRLREKIEKRPSHPKRIATIRGVGYRYLM